MNQIEKDVINLLTECTKLIGDTESCKIYIEKLDKVIVNYLCIALPLNLLPNIVLLMSMFDISTSRDTYIKLPTTISDISPKNSWLRHRFLRDEKCIKEEYALTIINQYAPVVNIKQHKDKELEPIMPKLLELTENWVNFDFIRIYLPLLNSYQLYFHVDLMRVVNTLDHDMFYLIFVAQRSVNQIVKTLPEASSHCTKLSEALRVVNLDLYSNLCMEGLLIPLNSTHQSDFTILPPEINNCFITLTDSIEKHVNSIPPGFLMSSIYDC